MPRRRSARRRATPQERAYAELGRLAESVHRLAGEVFAFDAATLAATRGRSGQPALPTITALAGEAEALVRALEARREAYVLGQLQRLRIGARTRRLRLNIGSGRFTLDRWLNVDLPPAPLGVNLRWGLPLPDGSVEYAFMSHVLEHFYYPDEALALLREVRRVLQPGGRVRLVVPDMEKWLVAYATGDRRFFAARRAVWPVASRGTRLEQLLLYAGSGKGSHPSYFFGHKSGYDFETLRKLLKRARFVDIERSDYMTSSRKPLRIDDHSAVADASFDGGHYSLFVEAAAPGR